MADDPPATPPRLGVGAGAPPASGLRRSVQQLLAGNGLAQGLQFAAVLVLSRLYQPADFGVLARVQSLGSVAAIVVSLQLHLSIPLAQGDDDVRRRTAAVETLAVLWGGVIVVLAASGWRTESLAATLAVILALANTYSSVLVFRGRFAALSLFYVARAIAAIAMQVTCGLLHVPGGLVLGALAGELLSAVLLRRAAVGLWHRPGYAPRAAVQTIREQSAFTVYGTVQELISVASFYAPVFLFTSAFDATTSGQYAMANRLVFAPVVLLSGSIAQVLYHRLGQQPPRTLHDFRALLPSAWTVPVLVLGVVTAFLLVPVYHAIIGARWDLASQLIPLQVVWGAVFLLSTPARVVCRVRLLQRHQLLIDCVALLLIGMAFWVWPTAPLGTTWRLVGVALLQNVALTAVVVRSLSRTRGGTA